MNTDIIQTQVHRVIRRESKEWIDLDQKWGLLAVFIDYEMSILFWQAKRIHDRLSGCELYNEYFRKNELLIQLNTLIVQAKRSDLDEEEGT